MEIQECRDFKNGTENAPSSPAVYKYEDNSLHVTFELRTVNRYTCLI